MTGPPGSFRFALDLLSQSRRARFGALVLACLSLAAIFADVLASDLPIACHIHKKTYILPNIARPSELSGYTCDRVESELGNEDWAVYPLIRFGPQQTSTKGQILPLSPPTLGDHTAHLLGTDRYGRDSLARLLHGARASLSAALTATFFFVALGTLMGAVAGFFGGLIDTFVARIVETLTAFPILILVLVVQSVIEHPTTTTLLITLGLTRWTEVARLVRAEVILISSQDYIVAARALGARPWRILVRHVIPNALAPVLLTATLGIASVVFIEASLDFLHVGLPSPRASWGEAMSEIREHSTAWWLLLFPGLALFATVASLNLVGETLRDVLDPRLGVPELADSIAETIKGTSDIAESSRREAM